MVEFAKIVTGRQMAEIDRRTVEAGTPGAQLMESAGRRVVEVIAERWQGMDGLGVVVACGRGNNGGDGFVVGRHLLQAGAGVRLFLAADPGAVHGDAALHREGFCAAGGRCEALATEDDFGAFQAALAGADVVVDALLGTGTRGAARGPVARAIECLNAAGRPVVAVDVPSGLDADDGRVHGPCVRAAITVTFGLPKVGQLFFPGRDYCGDLRLVDIGLAPRAVREAASAAYLLTEDAMAEVIPDRPGNAHKGSCGSVAVVAGSVGMTGAASLTAGTALAAGAGKVTLGVPASLNDILEVKLTEVMTRPLPEVRRHRCLALRGLGEALALAQAADVLAVGPGVGRHRETCELVRRLLERVGRPAVVDADALYALGGVTAQLAGRAAATVLTPHLGEFSRLTGLPIEQVQDAPLDQAGRFAAAHGIILVLKGAPTVVALADGRRFVNPTGNAGMATAGAGDVLTGLIAGLMAQGVAPEMAACLGVYLHGRAGDLARDEIGEWGLRAGDIEAHVPRALLATRRARQGPSRGPGRLDPVA
ncbi:MAG: NAD(P)H-hydrate dehydratase [Candidatus Latescibacterota bacterium]